MTPISQINWDRIRCGDTVKIVPAGWGAIITFIKFRNLQAKLRRRAR